jgi:hypothetical protein
MLGQYSSYLEESHVVALCTELNVCDAFTGASLAFYMYLIHIGLPVRGSPRLLNPSLAFSYFPARDHSCEPKIIMY